MAFPLCEALSKTLPLHALVNFSAVAQGMWRGAQVRRSLRRGVLRLTWTTCVRTHCATLRACACCAAGPALQRERGHSQSRRTFTGLETDGPVTARARPAHRDAPLRCPAPSTARVCAAQIIANRNRSVLSACYAPVDTFQGGARSQLACRPGAQSQLVREHCGGQQPSPCCALTRSCEKLQGLLCRPSAGAAGRIASAIRRLRFAGEGSADRGIAAACSACQFARRDISVCKA